MARLHLFEFGDLAWVPRPIREAITDFLGFIGAIAELPYRAFADRLARALERTGDDTLLDLASGGGGPAMPIARIVSRLRARPVRLLLSDLYPNRPRLDLAKRENAGLVDFVSAPVDATAVPPELGGFRLMSNAFHHLPPDSARACLRDAVAQRRGIAVCEFVSRSPLSVLEIGVGLFSMFLVTPFIRPFRLSRLLLTYVVPVVPICTLWDGVVSCLRAYDPPELRALVDGIDAPDYEWEIGRLPIPRTPAAITYLIGVPLRNASRSAA